jgi:hypothetical protein
MLDRLTAAEIQTVRLKLLAFADRQSDQTVRSQCLAVDAKLAEVLEGDNPILRQVLANSVEQLEEALRWAARTTIEKGYFPFSYRTSPSRYSLGLRNAAILGG